MMDKGSKIFITGATGFIGTLLVKQLLQEDYKVRCISRKPPVLPQNWPDSEDKLWKHPNFERLEGNVLDRDSIRKGMEGCRYVFHLAGYAKNYSKDPTVYQKTNIDAVHACLDTAKELKVEKVVLTSSIVTLGSTRSGEIGNEETSRISDRYYTEYEESKTIMEREVFTRIRNESLPVVIVNPTRVYGPGLLSEGNALAALIHDYSHGKMPFLPNRGINVGNYVLVNDVAQGHFLAMQNGRIGERYFLGGSENVTLREFFTMIDSITGKKHIKIPLLKPGPMIFSRFLLFWAKLTGGYPRITPGWMASFMDDCAVSCEKAKKELGYDPIPLEDGLKKTLDWLETVKI